MMRRNPTVIRALVALGVTAALFTTAGCAGGGSETPAGDGDSSAALPTYYPDDYEDIIAASKEEGGELLLYSNVDQQNIAPVIDAFKKQYPWVSTVASENLDSDVIFQRQLSDVAAGSTKADILISNAIQAWAEYLETDDAVLDYDSPEAAELPDFAQLATGVYAVSMDPVGLTYNSALFPGEPTSYAELAQIVSEDPSKFQGKIGARDVEGAWGFTASRALAEASPELEQSLKTLVPLSRPESSSGTQNEKLLSGEYSAGIVVSSAPAFSISADPATAELFKFVLPSDGVPVLGRGMGITPEAPHPATAKLFLDFILSEAGQNAVAEGGLTSYRDSVPAEEGRLTYQYVEEQAGADAIIQVPYEVVSPDEVTAFTATWKSWMK